MWLLAIALFTVFAATGSAAVISALSGERPVVRTGEAARGPSEGPAHLSQAVVELAGSGSNLPLTRRLAAAFNQRRGREVAIVHESIGSRGGLLAVRDGVIDLGLISRPLAPAEEGFGVIVIPYARVPVVVAAHPSVPDSDLTRSLLLALYRGAVHRWSDGSRVVLLQRERGDSSNLAFSRVLPEFAEVDEVSRREGRFEVLFRDREMQEALLTIPGAVGLFDLGAIRAQHLPLRVLSIDGVHPEETHLAAGAYPFVKELAFVALQEPDGIVADFIAFVLSVEGRAIATHSGYLPVAEQEDR